MNGDGRRVKFTTEERKGDKRVEVEVEEDERECELED